MSQKSVIITGGNKGIGLDIARVFINSNYKVIVGAREKTNAIIEMGNKVHFIECDVRSEASHLKLVKKAIEFTGSLDTYINNAGFSAWRSIENIDEKFLSNILDTNLKGVFWGCKAALSVMKSGASIINVSSIAGKRGSSNNSAYCSSKFGVNAITQSLAKEVGKKNIRVNAVCPVIIQTDGLMQALGEDESPVNGSSAEFIENFRNTQAALPALPTGIEVGEACLFLASAKASSITGQCINIDSGVFPQ